MEDEILDLLADEFETLAWSTAKAVASADEQRFRHRLAAMNRSLHEVLAHESVEQMLDGKQTRTIRVSDEALALAIQKEFFRDEAFVDLFLRRYREESYGFLWKRRFRQAPDREDLLQEFCMIQLSKGLRTYDPDRPFRAYYWKAFRNFVVDALRKRHRQGAVALPAEQGEYTSSVELDMIIEEALEKLPQQERVVFDRVIQGDKASDIAEALGIERETVYRTLERVRRFLRCELQGVERLVRPATQPRSRQTKDGPGGRIVDTPEVVTRDENVIEVKTEIERRLLKDRECRLGVVCLQTPLCIHNLSRQVQFGNTSQDLRIQVNGFDRPKWFWIVLLSCPVGVMEGQSDVELGNLEKLTAMILDSRVVHRSC